MFFETIGPRPDLKAKCTKYPSKNPEDGALGWNITFDPDEFNGTQAGNSAEVTASIDEEIRQLRSERDLLRGKRDLLRDERDYWRSRHEDDTAELMMIIQQSRDEKDVVLRELETVKSLSHGVSCLNLACF